MLSIPINDKMFYLNLGFSFVLSAGTCAIITMIIHDSGLFKKDKWNSGYF